MPWWKPSEAGKTGGQTQIATHVVQDLNAQFGMLEFQTQSEGPALLIDDDLNQGPDSFRFVGRVGNALP